MARMGERVMSIEDSFVWGSPNGPLVPATAMVSPDTVLPGAPLGGVNETAAGNNHGYPPNHSPATHADGVPCADDCAMPTGYNDDSNGQG